MKIEKLLVNTKLIEKFNCVEDYYSDEETINMLKDIFDSSIVEVISNLNDYLKTKESKDKGIFYHDGEIIYDEDSDTFDEMLSLNNKILSIDNCNDIIVHLNHSVALRRVRFVLFRELSVSFDDIKYNCYDYNLFKELIKQIKNQEVIELHMNNIEKP